MCKAPRPFSTTFRYSLAVQKVLDKTLTEDDSLADKIEFMCLDYFDKLHERQERIKELDRLISEKERKLNSITKTVRNLSDVSYKLESLLDSIKECNT